MGAEDYIVKPFEIIELIARVEVVLRRYHKLDEILYVAGLTIDTVSMTGLRCGCTVKTMYYSEAVSHLSDDEVSDRL